jgi:hypothetical protein
MSIQPVGSTQLRDFVGQACERHVRPELENETVSGRLRGGMYATVTTKLNPKGEIRGQIKASNA